MSHIPINDVIVNVAWVSQAILSVVAWTSKVNKGIRG